MAVSLEVNLLDYPDVETARKAIEEAKGGQVINRVCSDAVLDMFRLHFARLDKERPNKLGGRRTHFWEQVKDSTFKRILADGFTINIAQVGFRQRWKGGTIKAGANPSWVTDKPTKYLTIPVRSESYGMLSKKFAGLLRLAFKREAGKLKAWALVLAPNRSALKALAASKSKTIRAKAAKYKQERGVVYYLLKEQVTQQGDPSVMPTEEEMGKSAAEGLSDYARMLKARMKG